MVPIFTDEGNLNSERLSNFSQAAQLQNHRAVRGLITLMPVLVLLFHVADSCSSNNSLPCGNAGSK